ncbi:hypothetical protein [Tenacibaculum aestuariivivum]|uniref:hypothetical protein n=1 Tax=Tenacibaculum aestuariivivum TaxID=2006131 RepID=UPI003AB2F203
MSLMSFLVMLLQAITAITAILLYGKFKNRFFLTLRLILVVNVLVELVGAYYKYIEKNAFTIYIIYSGIVFTLITLMYLQIIKDIFWRKYLKLITFCFILFCFFAFLTKINFTYVVVFGALITVFGAFLYLKELLVSDKILNYKKMLPFWVTVGFLVFYLPSIPFFTLLKHMTDRGLFFILNALVILMNIFILYGLLCSKKEEMY